MGGQLGRPRLTERVPFGRIELLDLEVMDAHRLARAGGGLPSARRRHRFGRDRHRLGQRRIGDHHSGDHRDHPKNAAPPYHLPFPQTKHPQTPGIELPPTLIVWAMRLPLAS